MNPMMAYLDGERYLRAVFTIDLLTLAYWTVIAVAAYAVVRGLRRKPPTPGGGE